MSKAGKSNKDAEQMSHATTAMTLEEINQKNKEYYAPSWGGSTAREDDFTNDKEQQPFGPGGARSAAHMHEQQERKRKQDKPAARELRVGEILPHSAALREAGKKK